MELPMKEYEDYIKDWDVNIETKSAYHHSGLGISYDSMNEDGSLRVKYDNLMKWQKKVYIETRSGEEVEKTRRELTRQFAEIYDKQMQSPSKEINNISKMIIPQREI